MNLAHSVEITSVPSEQRDMSQQCLVIGVELNYNALHCKWCAKKYLDIVRLLHFAALSYCNALQPEFCQRRKNIGFACKEASASPDAAQPEKHKK